MERGTLIPLEEYSSTSYRPDRKCVDGSLLERNVGEWDHGELQMFVSAYFYNRRKELGIHLVPEQRVQLKETRFRVPDVCVVAGEPLEQILTSPLFLSVEILSKDDRMSEMQERIDDYVSFGVRNVWVLDLRTKRAYVHNLPGKRLGGSDPHGESHDRPSTGQAVFQAGRVASRLISRDLQPARRALLAALPAPRRCDEETRDDAPTGSRANNVGTWPPDL